MAEKNLSVRIVLKHDVEENWLKATGFIPKQGELIVYDRDDNYTYERFKIGDGETNVNDLPFGNSTATESIPKLTTQTVAIADLESGVYLWDYDGEKTLDYYSGTKQIYQNPTLIQISSDVDNTQKDFYLLDDSGGADENNQEFIWGAIYIDDEGFCHSRYLKNIPEEEIENIDTSTFVKASDDITWTGDHVFNGEVDFSKSNVIGLNTGGISKTKITLAELQTMLTNYSSNKGKIIQIVAKNATDNHQRILEHIGLLQITNKSSIHKNVSYTHISQSGLNGSTFNVNITTSSAQLNFFDWECVIADGATNTLDAATYTVSDNLYEFYVIGG